MLEAELACNWGRDIPTLYLVAEADVSLPLAGMVGLFERTPATRRMVQLRRADHMHFMDDAEQLHEAVRGMSFPGKLAWLPNAMQPVSELCSGEHAELFTRGLTLCHLDATLRGQAQARQSWRDDVEAVLARVGVDGAVQRTG